MVGQNMNIIVIIIAIIVGLTVIYTNTPIKGIEIGRYTIPKSALSVVDVQNDTTDNVAFYGDTTEFIYNLTKLLQLLVIIKSMCCI